VPQSAAGFTIDTSSSLPFIEPQDLVAVFRRHPRERILFGSDYPLFDPGDEMRNLRRAAGLTAAALEEILGNGAFLAASGRAPATPAPR
jgi:predicted TIM-barrel fold metal-dependent hydrolase